LFSCVLCYDKNRLLIKQRGQVVKRAKSAAYFRRLLTADRLVWFRYSFICHGTSTRRQWSEVFGLRVKLPPVTTSLTTQW